MTINNNDFVKKAAEEKALREQMAIETVYQKIKEAALGGYKEDIEKTAAAINDLVHTRKRETALYKQVVEVNSNHKWDSQDDPIFTKLTDLSDDVEQLFKSHKVQYINKAVTVPLAEYMDAYIEAYGAYPRSVQRSQKETFFPIIKITTPVIEWSKEDISTLSLDKFKATLEDDIEYAIGYKIDSIVLDYFEKAFAVAAANGWVTKAISANTVAQRSDWKAIVDMLSDQDLDAAKIFCHVKRARDIFMYPGVEMGNAAGDVFKKGAFWTDTIMNYPRIIHATSPIVKAGNQRIYAITDSKYIGKFYELSPLNVITYFDPHPSQQKLLLWAEQYVAFGLANVRGVTAIEFV